MKKLLYLLLPILTSNTIVGMEPIEAGPAPASANSVKSVVVQDNPLQATLPPEFQVSPLIMQIVRYGARNYGFKQLSAMRMLTPELICLVDKNVLAITINKKNIAEELIHIAQSLATLEQFNRVDLIQMLKEAYQLSDSDYSVVKILAKLYSTNKDIQDTILISPKLLTWPYGVVKIALLHELWHLMQPGIKACNPEAYPRGVEQEADMQAAKASNCRICVEEFAETKADRNSMDATRGEVLDVAHKMPKGHLCPYHQILKNKTLFRLMSYRRKHDTLRSLSGLTGLELLLNSLTNWLGRDVEEKIIRGEIEP